MGIEPQNIQEVIVSSYEQLESAFLAFDKAEERRTLFESRTWLNTWYKHYWQQNWQLHCIVYYHGNVIVGFAPFYIHKEGAFPYVSTLYFIGQGEPESTEVSSEYLDVQIKKGYEKALYPQLALHLNNLSVDLFITKAILGNSHIAKVLPLLRGDVNQRDNYRYAVECKKWSLQSVSKNTRSRIKRTQNQLQQFTVDIRWLAKEDIYSMWPTLAAFHQTRWLNKGNLGAFSSPEFNSFHLSLIKEHVNNIAISAIFIDNKPIAINYYLVDDSTFYFYQSGWDQKNYEKLSPGLYLHYWSIEHCHATTYDFMMGGVKDSYKSKFSCEKLPMLSVSLIRNKKKLVIHKIIQLIKRKFFKR
tara:strand:+ start:545 stop:1618 length:1074 start_codon:yes stop_codon:yes gene_type:complete